MSYRSSYHHQSSFESDRSNPQAGLLSEKQFSPSIVEDKPWITPRILSDFTIGLSDGLTVPFALTAGLSALGNGGIVVSAGLAELVAGAISMGVAGYLAAKGEHDAQISSCKGTRDLIAIEPEEALVALKVRFQTFQLPEEILDAIVNHYSRATPEQLLQTLLRLDENENDSQVVRPWLSGLTIAAAYFLGGFVPLVPYLFATVSTAFMVSVIITATVLFTFGCVKVPLAASGQGLRKSLKSGLEMLVLGGLAASAALVCVNILNHIRAP